jgi:hypothetical protein
MRVALHLIWIANLGLIASCGSSKSATPDAPTVADAPRDSPGLPKLTVDNTLSWCDVTVTVGTSAPITFSNASDNFSAAASTTVALHATPHPTFLPVVWTGVTTMNGADATYVMTATPAQSVTACCPLSNGTGC